jgi:hypothetical protein
VLFGADMRVTDAAVHFLFVLIESRLLQDASIRLLFVLSRMTANASSTTRVDSGAPFSCFLLPFSSSV